MFLTNFCGSGLWIIASAYQAFFIGQVETPGAKILQKTKAPSKCKFFIWVALHDRCWTAERRKCHNLRDPDDCIICAQEAESISHLLTGCYFKSVFGLLVGFGVDNDHNFLCFMFLLSYMQEIDRGNEMNMKYALRRFPNSNSWCEAQ